MIYHNFYIKCIENLITCKQNVLTPIQSPTTSHSSTQSTGNLIDIYQNNLDKIEISINNYDQQLRKLFSDAKKLQDERFPNIEILNER